MAGEYDFEEQERIAELRAWWEDNRWYVLGAVAGLLLAVAGYRGWLYWQARQADDAAAMYTPVAEAAAQSSTSAAAVAVDAFGERVGSEQIGLYSEQLVRGFLARAYRRPC